MALVVAHGTEQLEGGFEVLAHIAYRGEVATSIAVVWSTPHGGHVLVAKMVLVAFVD